MKFAKWIKRAMQSTLPIIGCSIFMLPLTSCSWEIAPEPTSCKITFSLNPDETLKEGSTTQEVDTGIYFGLVNSPIVTKEDYLFNGWSFEREGSEIPADYIVNEPITVFPLWIPGTTQNTNIQVEYNDVWYDANIDSLCTENEEQKIIITTDNQSTVEIERNLFNCPIKIGSGITHLPNYFLEHCVSFNSEITFAENSSLTYIGSCFLAGCTAFNNNENPLVLPSKVKCIYDNFLGWCSSFNQQFDLPTGIQIIGTDFLSDCSKFDKNFTIPEGVLYLGYNCMINCNSFTQTLNIDCPEKAIDVGTAYGWSANSASAPICDAGFTVTGKTKEYFCKSFPTSSDPISGIYRTVKLG